MFVLSSQVYLYRPLRGGALATELMEGEGHVTLIRSTEEKGRAISGVPVEGGNEVFVEFVGVMNDASVAVLDFNL